MDKANLQKLISLIVEEVVRRVKEQLRKEQHPEDVLVLLPEQLAYPQKLKDYLSAQFGESFVPIQFTEQPQLELEGMENAADLGLQGLFERISQARSVLLVSPAMALLQQIAAGDDRDLVAKLMIRSILWQKDVHVLLDFEPPRFQRNTFLATVASALETLSSMQVQIDHYDTGQTKPQERKDLITERDVLEAAQREDKTLRCKMNAIITPSARDAIASTGVILKY